jgi:hypothetical protein
METMTIDMTETEILQQLDHAIRRPRAAAFLVSLANDLEVALLEDPALRLAWRSVPLCAYDNLPNRLPEGIASSWVFALRSDCTSGAERHPNSIQRVMSYRGSADMQLWNGTAWESHRMASGADRPLDTRWLSIPTNVWHKPVMAGENWVVVSFHTAADDVLIEERPSNDAYPDAGAITSELYAGRVAR